MHVLEVSQTLQAIVEIPFATSPAATLTRYNYHFFARWWIDDASSPQSIDKEQ